MTKTRAVSLRCLLLIFVLAILAVPAVQAVEPKDSGSYLDQKEFFKAPMPSWKMKALMERYQVHYGLPDPKALAA